MIRLKFFISIGVFASIGESLGSRKCKSFPPEQIGKACVGGVDCDKIGSNFGRLVAYNLVDINVDLLFNELLAH